jgi:hypothetical protein
MLPDATPVPWNCGADDSVLFSNITLIFSSGSPAINHFGSQPIHGVVRGWNQQ